MWMLLVVALALTCSLSFSIPHKIDAHTTTTTSLIAASPLIPAALLMQAPCATTKCSNTLMAAIARGYMKPSNALQAFNTACSEYDLALKSECLDNAADELTCPMLHNMFDMVTSGYKFACSRMEYGELFTVIGSRLPEINQECTRLCNFTDATSAFHYVTDEGPQALVDSMSDPHLTNPLLTTMLDTLCTTSGCVLDCSANRIDEIAPGFGDDFKKLIKLPWEVAGSRLAEIEATSMRVFYEITLPWSCWTLMDSPEMSVESKRDDAFVKAMMWMSAAVAFILVFVVFSAVLIHFLMRHFNFYHVAAKVEKL